MRKKSAHLWFNMICIRPTGWLIWEDLPCFNEVVNGSIKLLLVNKVIAPFHLQLHNLFRLSMSCQIHRFRNRLSTMQAAIRYTIQYNAWFDLSKSKTHSSNVMTSLFKNSLDMALRNNVQQISICYPVYDRHVWRKHLSASADELLNFEKI